MHADTQPRGSVFISLRLTRKVPSAAHRASQVWGGGVCPEVILHQHLPNTCRHTHSHSQRLCCVLRAALSCQRRCVSVTAATGGRSAQLHSEGSSSCGSCFHTQRFHRGAFTAWAYLQMMTSICHDVGASRLFLLVYFVMSERRVTD